MKYVSLFSGIESASVAWGPLGWEPLAFAEVEPFPAALLAHRYPGIPNLGDVSRVDWSPYCGKADVVVGGSPCQAFSVAGLRKSLEDPRGNLTLEYVRAVHAIRPRYAIWENVPGVLSTNDNAFGCLLAALVGAHEALETEEGWPSAGMVRGPAGRAAWRLLDAQFFGLAQRRLRVFVVFCPRDGADPGEVLLERPRLLGNPPARGEAGQGVTHGFAGSLGASGRGVSRGGESRGQDPVAVPDASYALQRPGRIDGENETFVAEIAPPTDASYGRLQGQDSQHVNSGCGMFVATFQNVGQGWWNDRDTAATLRTPKGAGSMEANVVAHSLRATIGRNQGQEACIAFYPTGGTHGVSAREDLSPSIKIGSGVGIPSSPAIAYNLRGRDGGSMPESTNVASIRAASGGSSRTYVGVRRLTVAECEILQGFPVGYTAIPTGKARKISDDVAAYLQRHRLPCYRRHDRWYTKISADGPRYKALGNAMAVPVMRWIGERIYKKREDHPKIA